MTDSANNRLATSTYRNAALVLAEQPNRTISQSFVCFFSAPIINYRVISPIVGSPIHNSQVPPKKINHLYRYGILLFTRDPVCDDGGADGGRGWIRSSRSGVPS
jgi:hypothetical protein